jgi:hypothetical protein
VADLPTSTAQATSDAISYAQKNGGSLAAGDISYSTKYVANDTITVTARTTVQGTFLKLLGFDHTTVRASAVARAMPLGSATGAAPFAVYYTQPELSGPGCPCFGVPTTLAFDKVGPGGFELINIDGSSGGSGQTILAGWILNGCSCSTSTPVWLWNDSGAKFNSSGVNSALSARRGSILLFPVSDATEGGGTNMKYHVIAFVGFKVTSFAFNGNNGTITGSFEKTTWKGTAGDSSPGPWSAITTRLME